MVGWHHRLSGHEFEQAPGDGEGQRSLVCCSPWDHKELDTTGQLNKNKSRQRNWYGNEKKAKKLGFEYVSYLK